MADLAQNSEYSPDDHLRLTDDRWRAHRTFWHAQLQRVGEPAAWFYAPPRGERSAGADRAAGQSLHLTSQARARVESLAADPLGRFAVMVAAVALVRWHYDGCDPLVVHAPPLEGVTRSSIPIIIAIERDDSIKSFLRRTAGIIQESYRYSDFPIELLCVRTLGYTRDQLSNLCVRAPLIHAPVRQRFPLELTLFLDRHCIAISDQADRLEQFIRHGFLEHIDLVLREFADADKAVCNIALVETAEQRSYFDVSYAHSAPLPLPAALFEQSARTHSERVAVRSEDGQTVTYGELNRRANRLAHHLRDALGVGPETAVAILSDHSPELVVAILGVLKAGAAYVPLDPAGPEQRRATVMTDSGASILLLHSDYLYETPPSATTRFVLDLELDDLTPAQPNSDPVPLARPDNLAYILYTSGSTGTPKGCQISLGSLSNYLVWARKTYFQYPQPQVGLFTSVVFDLTITGLLGTLISGGTMHVARSTAEPSGTLRAMVSPDHPANLLKITPTHIQLIEQLHMPGTNVERVIVGGEQLTTDHCRVLHHLNPTLVIYNEYGPTEATVGCTVQEIRSSDRHIHIGKPIAGAQVAVLNHLLQACPVGIPGQLAIVGAGLARGYRERPRQSARSFRPHPYLPGVRCYLSGDMGRLLPDGNIECFGRLDDQIKIRGYRVELGDIAWHLKQHRQVKDAVILPIGEGSARTLTAFVSTIGAVEADELKRWLAPRLPEFMWPAHVVAVDRLPVNRQGKLDRANLVELAERSRRALGHGTQPQTATQRALAAIWQDVFAIEGLGIHSNFFELGGNSLVAMQILSRVWQRWGHQLELHELFEHATIAGLGEWLDEQIGAQASDAQDSDTKDSNTKERTAQLGDRTDDRPYSIQRANRGRELPLSFAQERLWLLHQLEGPSAVYNLSTILRWDGPLHESALTRTIETIVERHEALRTYIGQTASGQAHQVLAAGLNHRLVDLQEFPEDRRELELSCLLDTDSDTPFDLTEGPLCRISVFRLAPENYVIAVTMHHLISDLWSMGVLVSEFVACYQAFCTGPEAQPGLPDVPIQYADFAAWQRDYLSGATMDRHLAYWQKVLAGADTTPILPTDRPRPARQTFCGSALDFQLDRALARSLRALAHETRSTLYMVLMTAFALLLSHYSGRRDLLIGMPVANRHHLHTEGLIGFFVNILVLRADMTGNASFRQLLGRIKSAMLDAYSHQDMPFEKLVEAVRPQRDPSRSPLIQVMFDMHNAPAGSLNLPDVTLTPIERGGRHAKFDLTLFMAERDDDVVGMFKFNRDLFDAETMRALAGHLCNLLAALASEPDRSVWSASAMDERERHHVRSLCTGPRREQPDITARNPRPIWYRAEQPGDRLLDRSPHTVNELFERAAEADPDGTALRLDDQHISYGELNRRVNQLAHHLRSSYQVVPESPVGLLLPRSDWLVVSILAVLKSGGAFVPIDPAYPDARIRQILDDAGISALLLHSETLSRVTDFDGELFACDVQCDLLDTPCDNPIPSHGPDNLAYIIYTSGSTGTPKGCYLSHANLAHYIDWCNHTYFASDEQGHFALVTSPSFDFTLTSVFCPLTRGKSLTIADRSAEISDLLGQYFDSTSPVDTIKLTPSHIELLSRLELEQGTMSTVILGGEALTPPQVSFLQRLNPGMKLYNEYGPTEATVGCIVARLESAQAPIPIGTPIADTDVYIMDNSGRQVPISVPGEIYLGGAGLARGYHGRPALTASRFVPHPDRPGQRLYRTGDRARLLRQGTIEFLGRMDNQVKIRGFRVEPGEIEATMRQYPGVKDARVVVRSAANQQSCLTGYVIPSDTGLERDSLRRFLASRLPAYMVPAALFTVGTWPLTVHGKLDVGKLPASDGASRSPGAHKTPPRTATEQVLAAIWCNVLRLPEVGVDDNFFELGGDSILMVQVASLAGQHGLSIAPSKIFDHPTIAELASEAVRRTEGTERQAEMGSFPLLPTQVAYFESAPPRPHHYNHSILVEVPKQLTARALTAILHELVEHHDVFRWRFVKQGDDWVGEHVEHIAHVGDGQGIATWKLDQLDLSQLAPAEQRAAIEKHTGRLQVGMDLAKPPLARFLWCDMGEGRPARFLWIMHHLLVDGVSWRILWADLVSLYEQMQRGDSLSLPPRTSSFKSWAIRLREYAQRDEMVGERAYWLAQLPRLRTDALFDHMSGVAKLVESKQHSTGSTLRAGDREEIGVRLTPEQTEALIRRVPRALHTRVNEVLLTALLMALAEYTGRDDIPVMMEGHGREPLFEDVDVSRTVGWFTTHFPVRVAVDDDPIVSLKAIKECLRSVPKNGIGYGMLRYFGGQLHNSLPQVLFNYLGQIDQHFHDGGRSWQPVAEPTGDDMDPDMPVSYLLEVNGVIAEECLTVGFVFPPAVISREQAGTLAEKTRRQLLDLIARAEKPQGHSITPSDFPTITLGQNSLDGLVADCLDRQGSSVIWPDFDIVALSPLQEGLLFHALHDRDSSAYFEQLSCRIRGPLDAYRFGKAWRQVSQRHEVLRSAFHWQGLEHPVRVVYSVPEIPWHRGDWSQLDGDEQKKRWQAWLREDRAKGFQPDVAPLLRLALIRCADQSFYFCFSHHHLLLDGWSVGNLLNEVFAVYRAMAEQRRPELAPVRPYRDFINWLKKRDQRHAGRFWRDQLDGFDRPTPLPFDQNGLANATREPHTVVYHVPDETVSRVESFAARHRLTLNTLVRGAWALLLGLHSGLSDVVYGVTVAGRVSEIEGVGDMVGLFINTLPLRVKFSSEQNTIVWLRDLQRAQVAMEPYSYSSLAEIRSASELRGSRPLFESLLVFENYPVDDALSRDSADLLFDRVEVFEQSNVPLVLAAIPDDGLALRLRYDPDRFDRASAGYIVETLSYLLAGLASHGDSALASVTASSAEFPRRSGDRARHPRMDAGNAGPEPAPFHRQFEARVQTHPESIALVDGEDSLTYGQLNRWANGMARWLRKQGVGAGTRVALLASRSHGSIAAILAAVKLGAAYVPIDPLWPVARVRSVIDDCQARIALTPPGHDNAAIQTATGETPEPLSPPVFTVPSIERCAAYGTRDLDVDVSVEVPAYVMYTSGTTGLPKGAVVTHRAWMQLAAALRETVHHSLPPGQRFSLNGPLYFDTSVKQLAQLIYGHTLVWVPEAIRADGDQLGAHLAAAQVDVFDCTPSQLALLLATGWPESAALTPHTVLVGGESIGHRMWQQLKRQSRVRFYNLYGPTEATGDTTAVAIDCGHAIPVIGQPLPGWDVHLLDQNMRPVPIGVPGELHIGGNGLALGYLNRPAATAQAFLPHPFSDEPGARLYRTGDMARWLPDGHLQFLGRSPRAAGQAKIRGYRVESAEVARMLETHPACARAHVVVHEDSEGMASLRAYVVPEGQPVPTERTWRDFLRQRVPAYMVPSVVVSLAALPITRNGKIDVSALPEGDPVAVTGPDYVPPRDDVERRLVALWQQILERESIGVKEHFFDVGGHSLLAVRLMNEVGRIFETPLSLAAIVENPTIEAQAAVLRDQTRVRGWDPLVLMNPHDHRRDERAPLYLFPGAGGNPMYFYPLVRYLEPARPVYGVQAFGLDGVEEPLRDVAAIAARYRAVICERQAHGPYFLAGHSFGGRIAVELSQQLRAQGEEVAILAILDTVAPVFDAEPFGSDWSHARWLFQIAREIELLAEVPLDVTLTELESLPEGRQLELLRDRLTDSGWWPPGSDDRLLRGFVNVYRANRQTTYRPRNPVWPVPVALFQAMTPLADQSDPSGPIMELRKKRAWGWQPLSSVPIRIYQVPGDHLTMMREPHVRVLARRLEACLDRYQSQLDREPPQR